MNKGMRMKRFLQRMISFRFWGITGVCAVLIWFALPPTIVDAHNCSNFNDCYDTVRAAVAATVGLGMFAVLLSVGLDFVPGVGNVKGVIEGITGKDLVTGQELQTHERVLGIFGPAGRILGLGSSVSSGIRNMDNIGGAGRGSARSLDTPGSGRTGDTGSTRSGGSGRGNGGGDDGVGSGSSGPGNTGTVWDSVKPTQPPNTGTTIPKSFELSAGNHRYWVHANGTKHMAEYSTRNLSHGRKMTDQQLLTSFQGAVEQATRQGIAYNKVTRIDNWELIFSAPREAGQLPVIKHAVYIP